LQSIRTTAPSWACLIKLKTEFELEQVISMQLRNKITVVRNIRIRHLSFLKRKAQNAVVLSLEVVDGMVKATLKQLGKQFNSF